MRFHPNDIQRRSRGAAGALFLAFVFLVGSFFRAQVLLHQQFVTEAEDNRLREVPLPAGRALIRDRNGGVIAENVPGYRVSVLAPKLDSLRAVLDRISRVVPLSTEQEERAIRNFRRNASRPTDILTSASFDLVSRLEEHRVSFPGLIIQQAPKRYYPDGRAVGALVGYTSEISQDELEQPQYAGYKPGEQIGKGGIEQQYESRLRGKEGVRYVEVDARGRVIRDATTRGINAPEPATPLITNIDLDLQRFTAGIFGDSLTGAAVAMDPATGEVLAIHSAPVPDPNRFIGGVSTGYYQQLREDPRLPLVNKATQVGSPGTELEFAL